MAIPETIDNYLIYENEHFKIEHCHSCSVPGYLIVSPKKLVKSIHELPEVFQKQLGSILAVATKLIQEIINPVKIYCTQFGEEGEQLHFHVFPRTVEITAKFLKAFPEQENIIHGPVLLDWARAEYKSNKENVWPAVALIINEMRKRLTTL